MKRYEDLGLPVVIKGIPEEERWDAWTRWRLPDMLMEDKTRHYGFKVGGYEERERERDDVHLCLIIGVLALQMMMVVWL